MRRSCLLSVCAWLIVALAGCVEGPVENDSEQELPTVEGPVFQDGSPAPVQDVLSDCYESIGSFAVPAAEYWDRTPEGFWMAPYTALGTARPASSHEYDDAAAIASARTTPPDPTAFTGELVAVASACHDTSDTVVNRLLVFLMVEPPSDLYNEAAAFGHLLLYAYFTDSQAHADVMEAWGFGAVVHVGPVGLQVADDPGLRTSETKGAVDSWTAQLDTVVAGQPTTMEGSAARFFATDADGNLTGIADASFGSFDAMVGHAALSGSTEAGIWQSGAAHPGLGLQIWGHSNEWNLVTPQQPEDA